MKRPRFTKNEKSYIHNIMANVGTPDEEDEEATNFYDKIVEKLSRW